LGVLGKRAVLIWSLPESVIFVPEGRSFGSSHDVSGYGCPLGECGYVSRLAELASWRHEALVKPVESEKLAGTVSVPWLGEKSLGFLEQLGAALTVIPQNYGDWHLFVDSGDSIENKQYVRGVFSGIGHCRLEQPGPRYAEALLRSRTAVIYGGYNSLMDVLYAGVPALVVERGMRDNEQQQHLQRLRTTVGEGIQVISETEILSEQIVLFLLENLSKDSNPAVAAVNVGGATEAATMLNRMLNEQVRQ